MVSSLNTIALDNRQIFIQLYPGLQHILNLCFLRGNLKKRQFFAAKEQFVWQSTRKSKILCFGNGLSKETPSVQEDVHATGSLILDPLFKHIAVSASKPLFCFLSLFVFVCILLGCLAFFRTPHNVVQQFVALQLKFVALLKSGNPCFFVCRQRQKQSGGTATRIRGRKVQGAQAHTVTRHTSRQGSPLYIMICYTQRQT